MRARSHPVMDDFDRVPDDLAVSCLGSSCSKDAQKTDDGEDKWDDECLYILRTGLVGISGKIGNVQSEGSVVSQHRVEVGEKSPSKNGAVHSSALGYDCTVADGASGFV